MQIKRKNKKIWLIIGSSFFFIGIILLSYHFLVLSIADKEERKKIDKYYIDKIPITTTSINEETNEKNVTHYNYEINYIAILRIPKIGLQRGLYSKSSSRNNVNYNVQILKESDNPEVVNGNVILASHSGRGRIAHFKNLHKLDKNDVIYIDYNNKTFTYKVFKIYEIEKNGFAEIKRDHDKSALTLITCRHGTNKQIVVISYQENE